MELKSVQVPDLNSLPYLDKADPWSSHSQIKQFLAAYPSGSRVLDVGAATGMLGRMCTGMQLILNGIEPNCEWARLCRSYYHSVLCAALDQAPNDFICGHDVVVCADVLEHMPNPEAALQRLATLQPDHSAFLISVPNVANLWIRLNLLLGRFDYAERGILDRTHLRFFTRRTFFEMLHQCGLSVKKFSVTPVPLPLIHPLFESNQLGRAAYSILAYSTRLFPTLLGYQFIVEAVKTNNGRKYD